MPKIENSNNETFDKYHVAN
ncbi:Hypothetical protein SSCIU_01044 [Mammaliicoccus sciuri]|nr:Hypothetical protein SSCIU_01044 [Mammaliicoccus sciuri]